MRSAPRLDRGRPAVLQVTISREVWIALGIAIVAGLVVALVGGFARELGRAIGAAISSATRDDA